MLKNDWRWCEKATETRTFSTLIDEFGVYYSITIKFRKYTLKIYDSFKLLPMSEEKIAKSFKLNTIKGKIDYDKWRDETYKATDEEIAYIKNDCYIMREGLKFFFNENLTKITIASNALNSFKQGLSFDFRKVFPVLSTELDDEIRRYYKGGFCYAVKSLTNKIVHDITVYDVNSLYPYVMYVNDYPCGIPIYFKGKYKGKSKMTLHHIKSCFILKEGYLPTVQIKNSTNFVETEYLIDSDGIEADLYLPYYDLQLFLEHYNIITITYIDGYEFKTISNLFTSYIDFWIKVKQENTGGLRELAKLMLNALYGKFATRTKRISKRPYIEDDVLHYEKLPVEITEPIYTAVSVFVTSYARYHTITTAQKFHSQGRLLYCDTDSIHIMGKFTNCIKVDDKELGAWKKEEVFYEAKYLHAKCYYGYDRENKEKYIKVAGLPKSKEIKQIINITNFERGFSYGNCLKSKQINGGTALCQRPFQIR